MGKIAPPTNFVGGGYNGKDSKRRWGGGGYNGNDTPPPATNFVGEEAIMGKTQTAILHCCRPGGGMWGVRFNIF